MADKRAFAKFDVGYLDNPKMADVLDSSLHAICMHFASVLHCSQHLTDGLVAPKAMQRKVGGSESDIQLLLDAGLWHGPDHDCQACWEACPNIPENRVYVHDFLEHNRDAAQAKRVSEKRSRVAKEGWEKRKAGKADDANSMQIALQNEPVCNAEREREKEINSSSEVSDETPRPDVQELLDLLDNCIEQNGFKKPSRTRKNTDAARLLLDKDGYDVKQVSWMIRWATNDEFWRTNILSMSKLREKFDQLKAKAGVGNGPRPAAGFNGEIDVDAILGRDVWTPPAPPPGLSVAEEIEWKKQQRAAHKAERLEQAKKKLGAAA